MYEFNILNFTSDKHESLPQSRTADSTLSAFAQSCHSFVITALPMFDHLTLASSSKDSGRSKG